MNTKKFLVWICSFLLLGVFCLSSCREIFDKKFISEGTIEYQVKYLGNEEDNYMTSLMPEKMLCHFKNNKVALDLSGGMGLFHTKFIVDNEKKTFLQLVKMIQKKYATSLDSVSVKAIEHEFPEMKIDVTKETKEIAGYTCKKAVVTFNDPDYPDYPSFDIYFTEDINIKEPNWCTQYKEIDGVLMEYRMKKYKMEMQITAVNVVKEDIEDNVFELPEDYKIIPQQDLDDLFLTFN